MANLLLYVTLALVELNFAYKLTILHTNDIHARVEEVTAYGGMCFSAGNCYGGAARRATVVKEIRAKERNVVLLDAGDALTGTTWYNVYKGNATWTVMNELQYDAMTLGNHDFDDGAANTARFLQNLNFTVVMSNVDSSKEQLWPRQPPLYVESKILEIGGEKIGMVGYVLSSTPSVSKPGPGPNLRFLPELTSVKTATDELRKKGINKIIAVGHSGISMDKKIAEQVNGVDVVVGGHSNTFLYSGNPIKELAPDGPYPTVVQSSDGNKVPVVQAYAYGIYLGRLDIEFDSQGEVTKWSGEPILLDNTVAKDSRMQTLITSLKGKVDNISKRKIGRSLVYLNGKRNVCRLKECNLGNLVTDAMVSYYANNTATRDQWTSASIALMSGDSIMASIDVSPDEHITYGHTLNSFPYRNTVDLVELKGDVLKSVLEHSVSSYDGNKPARGFLQVSGIKVEYNIHEPAGQRVNNITILCSNCREPVYQPLNHTATYNVIMNSYMANGGAGYTIIKERRLAYRVGRIRCNDVLADFITANSPVMPKEEGRITFISGNIVTSDGRKIQNSAAMLLLVKTLMIGIIQLIY